MHSVQILVHSSTQLRSNLFIPDLAAGRGNEVITKLSVIIVPIRTTCAFGRKCRVPLFQTNPEGKIFMVQEEGAWGTLAFGNQYASWIGSIF
jgi:hypothetical protein